MLGIGDSAMRTGALQAQNKDPGVNPCAHYADFRMPPAIGWTQGPSA
jgi:hypothetical protein